MSRIDFLIITGMSGAGKTTAVKTLEDMGFAWVDNLPIQLMWDFYEFYRGMGRDRIVIALHNRDEDFNTHLRSFKHRISPEDCRLKTLFLDSPDEVLVNRFSQNYRIHPLAPDGRIIDGIQRERELLEQTRNLSDITIDTGGMSTGELREQIIRMFKHRKAENHPAIVNLVTFGYKYGLPTDADMIFDARVLPNPYYVEGLAMKDGRDPEVRDYVFAEQGDLFLKRIEDLLLTLLPMYISRGKPHLTAGIGCTGGRHRSVAIAEALFSGLREKGYDGRLFHRDVNK